MLLVGHAQSLHICKRMVSRYPAGQGIRRRDLEEQIDSKVEKKGSLC